MPDPTLEKYKEILEFFLNPHNRKNMTHFLREDFFFSAAEAQQYFADIDKNFADFLSNRGIPVGQATASQEEDFYRLYEIDSVKIENASRVKKAGDQESHFFLLVSNINKRERFSSVKDAADFLDQFDLKIKILLENTRLKKPSEILIKEFCLQHKIDPEKIENAKLIYDRGYVMKSPEMLREDAKNGQIDPYVYKRLEAAQNFYRKNWNEEKNKISIHYKVQPNKKSIQINSGLAFIENWLPYSLQHKLQTMPGLVYDDAQPSYFNRGLAYFRHEIKTRPINILYTKVPHLNSWAMAQRADAISRYLLILREAGKLSTQILTYQNQIINDFANDYQHKGPVQYVISNTIRQADNSFTQSAQSLSHNVIYTTMIPTQIDQTAYQKWREFTNQCPSFKDLKASLEPKTKILSYPTKKPDTLPDDEKKLLIELGVLTPISQEETVGTSPDLSLKLPRSKEILKSLTNNN